jgi:hypothetical protein
LVEDGEKTLPELEALLGLWQRRYGAARLPERPRFVTAELERWARNLARIEFDREQFRVRSFGYDLIRRFGRESTNHYVEDLALDIATSLREVLLRAVAAGTPALGKAVILYGRAPAIFSDLALPLARAEGSVSHLLLASYEITGSKAASP